MSNYVGSTLNFHRAQSEIPGVLILDFRQRISENLQDVYYVRVEEVGHFSEMLQMFGGLGAPDRFQNLPFSPKYAARVSAANFVNLCRYIDVYCFSEIQKPTWRMSRISFGFLMMIADRILQDGWRRKFRNVRKKLNEVSKQN